MYKEVELKTRRYIRNEIYLVAELGGKMRNIKAFKERILGKKQFIIGTLGVTGLI